MQRLEKYRAAVTERLENMFAEAGERPRLLNEAMWYSIKAGGKRLRPCMLLAAVDMLHGNMEAAIDFACAVEMIHTYSLIHDDLPGMDNDVMRRGMPTNHVVYGVGQAILAGDGLLNMAFEVMLEAALKDISSSGKYIQAIAEIAKGAGVTGMIAGQCIDLDSEQKELHDIDVMEQIHYGKTACMFIFPLRAAARLCDASNEEIEALTKFALAYGLMFQAADDLTDAIGDSALAGKTLGKDEQSGKLTAVSAYGIAGTKQRISCLLQQANDALDIFGQRADVFRAMAEKASKV